MTATIFVCDTCGFSADEKLRDGRSGGELFGDLVIEAAAGAPGLRVERQSCLMGCEHPCNAALSAEGKLSYVLGRFEPTRAAAEALVDYAGKYAASASGQVPYRDWPQGVKGRFIARIPPRR